MAKRGPRERAPSQNVAARGRRDSAVEVSRSGASAAAITEEERQIREKLVEYFAILREWDLKLRLDGSEDIPEFHRQ